MSDTPTKSITIRTDGGEFEQIENVADVAEIMPGRLQVVYMDETSEFVSGSLFGSWGPWKMWIDRDDDLRKLFVDSVMTYPPNDTISYDQGNLKFRSSGRIKRLKQPSL
jgi:hypothetical protein